jgi:lysophospholipase L1-like esterase
MTEPPKKPPLYFKLSAAVLSLAIFLLTSELVLRAIDPELSYKNQFFPLNRDIDFPEFYEKDANLFWKLRKNKTIESRWFSNLTYHINSLGLRGPDFDTEKRGYRILALGNSCTFGWGVPYEQCWTANLQQLLNESTLDTPVEVINAGIPGYTSYQGKILFEKLSHLNPDMVLVTYGWNDHWRAGHEISDAEQSTPPQFILDLQNTLSKLVLYKLIRKAALSVTEDTVFVRLDDITGRRRVSPTEFADNLKDIIKSARDKNIEPVLIIPPIASLENYFRGTQSNFHLLHEKYQEVVVRVGEYQAVPVVNLQRIFDEHQDLFDNAQSDPIHFNARGHQLTAETLYNELMPSLQPMNVQNSAQSH